MLRKPLLWVGLAVFVIAPLLWVERQKVVVGLVRLATPGHEVAPYEPIRWQVGPETAERAPDDRRPNIVVILADDVGINGMTLDGGAGYVGLPEVNAPYRGWKGTFFEGGIRAPFFFRWPSRIEAGSQDARPVAQIDLAPTLAAAAGAKLPEGVMIDGIDLLDPDVKRTDDALFWQSGYYQVVRHGDWKLQLDAKRERVWLYDLATDPTEERNVASEEPERVAALRSLLDAHLADAREPIYPSNLEGPNPIDKTRAEPFEPGDEYAYWAS